MKPEELSNQCKSCIHKQHPDGGHCYMFKKEPEGCLIYDPIRQPIKNVRPSLKSRVWFQMVGIKDIITLAIVLYNIKRTHKDKTK